MLCGSPAKSRRDSAARSIGAAESVAATIRHDATVMRFILAPLLARTSRRLIPIVQDKRASRTPHGGVGVPVFRTLVSSLSNQRADCERSGSSTLVGIAGAVRFDRRPEVAVAFEPPRRAQQELATEDPLQVHVRRRVRAACVHRVVRPIAGKHLDARRGVRPAGGLVGVRIVETVQVRNRLARTDPVVVPSEFTAHG